MDSSRTDGRAPEGRPNVIAKRAENWQIPQRLKDISSTWIKSSASGSYGIARQNRRSGIAYMSATWGMVSARLWISTKLLEWPVGSMLTIKAARGPRLFGIVHNRG